MITKKELIQSPLNYIGGKYKLLPQLLPLFPNDITTFIDLFAGGCNVGININCKNVIFNDSIKPLIHLFETFEKLDKKKTFALINNIITKYKLTRSFEKGYEFYNCESGAGLSSYNKESFLKLRYDFNSLDKHNYEYYIMFYVLIIYSFNNQIRFNGKGEFNLPVGKRDFNSKMQYKLGSFIDRLKYGNFTFINSDFKDINITDYETKTFIYADPPYLITSATYNEQGGWSETTEKELLTYLDNIHSKGYRFALSNVLESKGKKNKLLIDWAENNKGKYSVIDLNFNYSNSNYQKIDRTKLSKEVLIINY